MKMRFWNTFKPIEIVGGLFFITGLSFKFLHYPGAPILMIIGCLLYMIYLIRNFIKMGKNEITKSVIISSITFWMIYILFRFQYWDFIIIPMIIATIFTIVGIIFMFIKKDRLKTHFILMIIIYAVSLTLFFLPTHKLYYLVNLNETLNSNYNSYNYRVWNKYSWFLYTAGEYEKSLTANSKAIDAANNYIKSEYIDKSILIDIEDNRKKILSRNWSELK